MSTSNAQVGQSFIQKKKKKTLPVQKEFIIPLSKLNSTQLVIEKKKI